MSKELQDRVAVVTGGTTGIGLAVAKRFVAEGAEVYVTGRRQETLDAAVADIGERAHGIRSDAGDLADLDRLFAQVRERSGRIDVLVANAGGGVAANLGDITEEQFDATFGTNVKGVVFTVQKALPLLAEHASVIIVGSTVSATGLPGGSIYAATKSAVRNFVRSWIVELKGRNIRINVLSPGPTRTPGMLGLADAFGQQAFLDAMTESVPLGRIAEPDEIAKAAVFLASDAAGYVNGTEFFVDGGQAQT
jgi:NAD(P)-dependent dehydrogenase (short-subunit alcohol dehydrogenase family)